MKRKLFFLFERLEIKRSERITIGMLFISLVLTSSFWMFRKPYANYSEEEYNQLEKVFEEKSRSFLEDQELILARYHSQQESSVKPSQNIGKDTLKTDSVSQSESYGSTTNLININAATLEQLQELPGIGPAYARRILDWIEENGAFTSKDQLLQIKGIGEKRLAKIKPLITL